MKKPFVKYAVLLLATLAAWPLNTLASLYGEACANLICALLAAAWIVFAILRGKKQPLAVIAGGGFVLGLVFVLKLHHMFSWHDLASYNPDFTGAEKPDGHLGYIAYLVEFGRLPLHDPRIDGYSVFYNPPLYHILQAALMKINLLAGVPQEAAVENLQLTTLFFASACTLAVIDLLRTLGASEKGVRTGAALMACQPMLLILGATLNNDILTVFCMLLCVLFTLRWHNARRMGDIIGAGLSLGAGMAAKLNAALLIPCVAVVFATAFLRDLKRWKRYMGQFAAFLCVSVPQAVAWPLFHLIAYRMPLNYVRLPAETINVSAYSLWQRYGIPDGQCIRQLFYSPTRKLNHNVWMQTLKTGMFDEMVLFEKGTPMWYVSYLALVIFAAVLLVSLALFVRWLCRRGAPGMPRLFLGGWAAVLLGNYLTFTLQYPYLCTFNFRYIAPLLALCAVGWGMHANGHKWLRLLLWVFAAMVCVVYGAYFFGKG